MRFQIFEDRNGGWRWRLVAGNNRIVADSAESYVSQLNASRAVTMLQDFGQALFGSDVQFVPNTRAAIRKASGRKEKNVGALLSALAKRNVR